MLLGDRIKEQRQAAKDSQEKLAEKLGVTRQTIISWEKGRTLPDSESLIKIAKTYQLSLDDWLGLRQQEVKKRQQHLWQYLALLIILLLACVVALPNVSLFPLTLGTLLVFFITKELVVTK